MGKSPRIPVYVRSQNRITIPPVWAEELGIEENQKIYITIETEEKD